MTKSKKTDKTMVDEIILRKLKIGQPYKIIFLSFNSNTTDATRGAGNSFSYLEFSMGFGLPNL
jgi:hypothetical protein